MIQNAHQPNNDSNGRILEFENLCKSYWLGTTELPVLRNINVRINRGEYVAIMGPSGSGKSTLLNMIGCLDRPTSGKYFLGDKEVSKLDDNQLSLIRGKEIGFVFQSFNLLPRTTVLRNVMLPLLFTGASEKEKEKMAREALKYAGMEESKFFNLSNQLSGGQMQRVAIARALINNPAIILADEPTGNLDTKTSRVVMETLKELSHLGHTIILITHEVEIANYANRIISIRDGLIEKDERKK